MSASKEDPFKAGATEIAIGLEDNKVVMRFKSAVTWMKLDPDQSVAIGDELIACGIKLGVEVRFPEPKRDISDTRKIMLQKSIAFDVRNLMEQGKSLDYIAQEMVEQVLREVL